MPLERRELRKALIFAGAAPDRPDKARALPSRKAEVLDKAWHLGFVRVSRIPI
jgi:hypothetical protein